MGMFDYIECNYPLPDGFFAEPSHQFQTKDTPDQMLSTYIITETGWLTEKDGTPLAYDGLMEFYASNISGSGPHGYMTSDDSPAYQADYRALFDGGKLLWNKGAKEAVDRGDRKQLTRKEWYAKHR